MNLTIVDKLSMGASISTMLGLFIAVVSLWNYYREKREQLEYEVKKDFFEGDKWDFFSDDEEMELEYFALCINNAPFSEMSGEIEYLQREDSDVIPIENFLFFEVLESYKKEITLKIFKIIKTSESDRKISGLDLTEETLGTATLKHISPYEFIITFNKNCLPNFPRTARSTCLSHYARITRERHEQRVKNTIK